MRPPLESLLAVLLRANVGSVGGVPLVEVTVIMTQFLKLGRALGALMQL